MTRREFMQVRCKIKDNGDVEICCLCLKTDSWLDYQEFKQDAREAFARRDVKAYATYLRAGLFCLFAHFEAVVDEIVRRDEISDKPCIPKIKSQSLRYRVAGIVAAAAAAKITKIPALDFDLEKNLRDICAHPGVEKTFKTPGKPDVREDYSATYERLDFQALERFEAQVSPFLDALCGAFGVTRLEDTEGFSEDVAKLAGGQWNRNVMPEGGPE
jgi:hypothetical protein